MLKMNEHTIFIIVSILILVFCVILSLSVLKNLIMIVIPIGVILFVVFLTMGLLKQRGYNENLTSRDNLELSHDFTKKEWENIFKSQGKMTKMLEIFDKVCRGGNFTYWVTGGTLIGAIRHKGFIPWDGDVDVCMLESDFIKFKELVLKYNILGDSMFLQDSTTDSNYKLSFPKIRDKYSHYISYEAKHNFHRGLQIDIFLYNVQGNKLKAVSRMKPDIINWNYDIIFPLKRHIFENFQVNIPNDSQKYLKVFDKKNYPPKLPSVNSRLPHEGKMDPFKPSKQMLKDYPELYN